MRLFTAFLFFLFGSVSFCSAQITFQKTFDFGGHDGAYYMKKTSDGGYILTGLSYTPAFDSSDIFLLKLDSSANVIWSRTFDIGTFDYAYTVNQTVDGGYLICGMTDILGNQYTDACVIKTDNQGQLIWSKQYGGATLFYGFSMQLSNDGGFVMTGLTFTVGGPSDLAFLMKCDSSGNLIWSKTFGGGGTHYDYARYINITSDGGYIIAGWKDVYGSNNNSDVYLIKVNVNGDTLWTKVFGGTTYDMVTYVAQTSDGGYVLTGQSNSYGSSYDVYLVKTDSNGNPLWTKTYGGWTHDDAGVSLLSEPDGGYVIVGLTYSFGAGDADVYLLKTDSAGNLLWSKTFGSMGRDVGWSVTASNDGGYILVGFSYGFSGDADVYVIKTDSSGNSNCNEDNPLTLSHLSPPQFPPTVTYLFSFNPSVSVPVIRIDSGANDVLLCQVGINESSTEEINISFYPNPATDEISFIIADESNNRFKEVRIYDVLGNKVYENNFTQTINVSTWSNGIYFVRVKSDEGIKSLKLLVQH